MVGVILIRLLLSPEPVDMIINMAWFYKGTIHVSHKMQNVQKLSLSGGSFFGDDHTVDDDASCRGT